MPDKSCIQYTGLLVISFAACLSVLLFFTANYVDPASSGSSFEPCHKIAINVAFLHEKNATSLCRCIRISSPRRF